MTQENDNEKPAATLVGADNEDPAPPHNGATPRGPPVKLPEERPKKVKVLKSHGVVDVGRAKQAAKLHVLVWPEGAGNPYPLDVEPDDEGWFYLDKKRDHGPYLIRPGTVVHMEGKYRAWIREGYYETLDPRDLGMGPHPDTINGLQDAAIIAELEGLSRRRMSGWQKAGMAGITLLALAFLGVMVWGIISIGNDISGLREALTAAAQANSSPPPTPGTDVGHQPISPGGN